MMHEITIALCAFFPLLILGGCTADAADKPTTRPSVVVELFGSEGCLSQDDLSTQVPAGENTGRTLHHAAVVRSLTDLATLKPGDAMPLSFHTKIAIDKHWKMEHLHASVFLQSERSMQISGSASVALMRQQK